MKLVKAFWRSHGTKLLGTASAILGGLILIPGLIPLDDLKYWQALDVVLGVLTVRRGFVNSRS